MEGKIGARLLATLKPLPKPYDVWDTDLAGFIVRVQPTGVMTFFCSYRRKDGRRTRVSLGRANVLTPSQARDAAINALASINSGRDPVAERRKARSSTLRAFLTERYSPWVATHRKSAAATLARLERCFSEILDKPINEVSPWLIDKWRIRRKSVGISSATINRDLTALKAALSKAVEWELVDSHPLQGVKPLRTDANKNARFLSQAEEMELRQALEKRQERMRRQRESANLWRRARDYEEMPSLSKRVFTDHLLPMVLLSMNTGLRRGELFQLKWEHLHFERKILHVDAANSKAEKSRHLPLNKEAFEVLQIWHAETRQPNQGHVFRNEDGTAFRDIKHAWRGLIEETSIRNFRWHDLRHHFASRLVMAGVDLNTVRELLGHAEISMTLRYAHLAPHVKAEAVSRLDATNPEIGRAWAAQ